MSCSGFPVGPRREPRLDNQGDLWEVHSQVPRLEGRSHNILVFSEQLCLSSLEAESIRMITEVEMGKGGKEGFPGAGVFKALVRPKMKFSMPEHEH